jgi:transcriptional regulator with XRE-family HTH domain
MTQDAWRDTWAGRVTGQVVDEVKRLREERKWSAQRLSDECKKLGLDLSRATISDLENHRRTHFGIPELLVMARALGVSPLRLLFRVGIEAEAEVLPGDVRSPFRSAQWFAGLGPYPEPGDDGVVTIPAAYDSLEAGPLALYRAADRMYELERRELSRAAGMAASAVVMPDADRSGYMAAADAHRQVAESARAQREDLRKRAAAAEPPVIPPPADMSLRPPGDALIV